MKLIRELKTGQGAAVDMIVAVDLVADAAAVVTAAVLVGAAAADVAVAEAAVVEGQGVLVKVAVTAGVVPAAATGSCIGMQSRALLRSVCFVA